MRAPARSRSTSRPGDGRGTPPWSRSRTGSPSAPRRTPLGKERPGYGFVDEQTPELAIAVVPSARGRGVGSKLIEALLARAREAGYDTISLSVDRTNAGAIELYGRHGFEQVGESDDSVTMLAQLDTQATEGTETA